MRGWCISVQQPILTRTVAFFHILRLGHIISESARQRHGKIHSGQIEDDAFLDIFHYLTRPQFSRIFTQFLHVINPCIIRERYLVNVLCYKQTYYLNKACSWLRMSKKLAILDTPESPFPRTDSRILLVLNEEKSMNFIKRFQVV